MRAIVQARMSSRRFPGKVLAPLAGAPLIDHVVTRVGAAVGQVAVVVATSTDHSDDPLAVYLASRGIDCFRGPLDNVFRRFQLCSASYPSEWVVRVCADSPLIDPEPMRRALTETNAEVDIVSSAFPRQAAHGQSIEIIRAGTLLGVDDSELDDYEREHVLPFFYRRPERFELRSIVGTGGPDVVVDTVEDLVRLEAAWGESGGDRR